MLTKHVPQCHISAFLDHLQGTYLLAGAWGSRQKSTLLSEAGRLLLETWGFDNNLALVERIWNEVPLALQLLTSCRLSLKSEIEGEVSKLSKIFGIVSTQLTSPVFHTDERDKRVKKKKKKGKQALRTLSEWKFMTNTIKAELAHFALYLQSHPVWFILLEH